MKNNGLKLSRLPKLIVLSVCLLTGNQTFGQSKSPNLIVVEQDTLVAITRYDFNLILFGFSYINSLEGTNNIASKQLSRQDSINTYLNKQLSLERSKFKEQDSIIVNLETVIKKHEKKAKRERLKQSLIYTIGGIIIGAETGLLFYQLLK